MTRMDRDIEAWQREGSLFGSYDDPKRAGDRLCVETHNVYHHDEMVQVGPFHVHKTIYEGHFYPPKPDHYLPHKPTFDSRKNLLLILALSLIGVGIGFLIPV